MTVWKIFIGGAADDWGSHIVKEYEARYRAANPRFHCRYFSWTDGRALHRLLTGEAQGGHVTLVGHSLGANAAFYAMGHVPIVDVLISIDPVGPIHRPWASIRPGARVWLNVRAEPKGHRTRDDLIAGIGRKYPRPPLPPSPGAPNYSTYADWSHGDFVFMLVNNGGTGVSGAMLLGGKTV